jgi:hypothetical protein
VASWVDPLKRPSNASEEGGLLPGQLSIRKAPETDSGRLSEVILTG